MARERERFGLEQRLLDIERRLDELRANEQHLADYQRAADRRDWRLDALDKWREQVDERISALEGDVERMNRSDQIADAVADRMKRERRYVLTTFQKLIVTIVGAITLADLVKGLVG